LGAEYGFLVGKVVSRLPSVEADLSDRSAFVQVLSQQGLPVFRTLLDAPGMDAVTGDYPGVALGKRGDLFPVAIDGSVNDGGGDTDLLKRIEDLRQMGSQGWVLEVIVRVEEWHGGAERMKDEL
jgi:hypothetical protein